MIRRNLFSRILGRSHKGPSTRLARQAARGDTEAQFQIGRQRLSAGDPAHSPADAVVWLKRAAQQGHVLARHHLSLIYLSGARGRGPAAAWLAEASRQSQASSNASLFYPDGGDVAPDGAAAFEWARAAATQGLACAQANLGMLYLRGVGCAQDFAAAREWCERSAAQGDAGGALGLGILHEHGLGVKRDYDAAIRWYRKAADQGNDAAKTALGLMFLNGIGVARDPDAAMNFLAGPAARGNTFAKRAIEQSQPQSVGDDANAV